MNPSPLPTNIIPFAPMETYIRPLTSLRTAYRLVCHAKMDASRVEVVVIQRIHDSMNLVLPRGEFEKHFRPSEQS